MRERLEAFCNAVNEKWPNGGTCRHPLVNLVDLHHPTKPEYIWDFYINLSDQDNAEFIIWCLDRLEDLGHTPFMAKYGSPQSGSCGYQVWRPGGFEVVGPTRALACFNALCACLGVE